MPAFSPKQMDAYRPRIETTGSTRCSTRRWPTAASTWCPRIAAPLPISGHHRPARASRTPTRTAFAAVRRGPRRRARRYLVAAARRPAHAGERTELDRLFESLFELRRREPADDIVSQIVAAEGDQIQPDEMLPMCVLLLIAGFETTVNLIGNGGAARCSPIRTSGRLLCAGSRDGLAPKAVEETLRYDPPVQRTGRIALEPVGARGPARAQRISSW